MTPQELEMKAIYERRVVRPDLASFPHVGIQGRREDAKTVEQLKARLGSFGDVRGDIVEAFLTAEIERANWFGASVFTTTAYDDYVNGVDLVLEFDANEEERPWRLAVDVTTSVTPELVQKKLAKMKNGAQVKYFQSDLESREDGTPVYESLAQTPLVVLGFDREYVATLAKEAAPRRVTRSATDTHGRSVQVADYAKDAFRDHPVGALVLEQARVQLAYQLQVRSKSVLDILQAAYPRNQEILNAQRLMRESAESVYVGVNALRPIMPIIEQALHDRCLSPAVWSAWRDRLHALEKVVEAVKRQKENGGSADRARVLGKNFSVHQALSRPAAYAA
jgi:hypothetical protein